MDGRRAHRQPREDRSRCRTAPVGESCACAAGDRRGHPRARCHRRDAVRGHFFGHPHTLARYEHAFYRPLLSQWSTREAWIESGGVDARGRATRIWQRALEEYEQPRIDEGVQEELEAFVKRRKIEIEKLR
ncbi:MAG: trimethylamine methyltransferase family protein [Gammaproteobacteria bacterium]|nr:trimethylamine methyltransferase family protein [Gammaproteobacteria bacterium]